jgi:predicted acyl esterase
LRLFDPAGKEVLFHGANDPRTPIGLGWLRASHRKLDPTLSLPYRPYHSHDELQPLEPGEAVELDIEIWPTCIVIPPGHRLGLWVRGKDYDHGGPPLELAGVKYTMQGVGPFKHDEPSDRPADIFGGTTTLHFGKERQPYVLLPVIPPKQE